MSTERLEWEACHCGNVETEHRFRHAYQPLIKVIRESKGDFHYFVVDCEKYPNEVVEKCGHPQCGKPKGYHTKDLDHTYTPVKHTFRRVKLSIPEDSRCVECLNPLLDHYRSDLKTHHFSVPIKFLNLKDTDELEVIYYEDDEFKIDVKILK